MAENSNNSLIGLLAIVVLVLAVLSAAMMTKGRRNATIITDQQFSPAAPVTPASPAVPSSPPARPRPNFNINIISGGSPHGCRPGCRDNHHHHYDGRHR